MSYSMTCTGVILSHGDCPDGVRMTIQMKVDERFKKGLELFNEGKFYECHEVIEGLWLETNGKYKDFYKGVIQAAVALHHLKRWNLNGAKHLFRTSTRYLTKYKPCALGLNVEKLIDDMKTCFVGIGSLKLKKKYSVDRKLIPKLEWR